MLTGELVLRWVVVGMMLFAVACKRRPNVQENGACHSDSQCEGKLRCSAQRCVLPVVHEQALLRQSGVAEAETRVVLQAEAGAEPPAKIVASGAPVRLRRAAGETPVFAACAADERLVGGGCSGGDHCVGQGCAYLRSYPSSPDPADTLGGRWHCSSGRGEVRAHALCQSTH